MTREEIRAAVVAALTEDDREKLAVIEEQMADEA